MNRLEGVAGTKRITIELDSCGRLTTQGDPGSAPMKDPSMRHMGAPTTPEGPKQQMKTAPGGEKDDIQHPVSRGGLRSGIETKGVLRGIRDDKHPVPKLDGGPVVDDDRHTASKPTPSEECSQNGREIGQVRDRPGSVACQIMDDVRVETARRAEQHQGAFDLGDIGLDHGAVLDRVQKSLRIGCHPMITRKEIFGPLGVVIDRHLSVECSLSEHSNRSVPPENDEEIRPFEMGREP